MPNELLHCIEYFELERFEPYEILPAGRFDGEQIVRKAEVQRPSDFHIKVSVADIRDQELFDLLVNAYVGGGFTQAQKAAQLFQPKDVKSRGDIVSAWSNKEKRLVGIVIVVMPDYPARRLAGNDEAELHLLAVDPAYQGHGLGRELILAALDLIGSRGLQKTVLWTQPRMLAAQQLYKSLGFVRNSSRDPIFENVQFLAYEFRR